MPPLWLRCESLAGYLDTRLEYDPETLELAGGDGRALLDVVFSGLSIVGHPKSSAGPCVVLASGCQVGAQVDLLVAFLQLGRSRREHCKGEKTMMREW